MCIISHTTFFFSKCEDLESSVSKAGDVAQLDEGLPHVQEALGSIPQHPIKSGVVATLVHSALIGEVEAGRCPQLHSEYQASSSV